MALLRCNPGGSAREEEAHCAARKGAGPDQRRSLGCGRNLQSGRSRGGVCAVGRGLAAVVFRPRYTALSCATGLRGWEARPASSDARCGPSREDVSGGPSGQGPEVVGRGDVCPVLCWPGERGGLLRGLSEPRTRAALGFRKHCRREGARGSPRGNPDDLGVRPPGFRAGGASGSGAEDPIGSQDLSPPVEASSSGSELRSSPSTALPVG